MPNVLKQRATSKQAMYEALKDELNKIISAAMNEYKSTSNEYGKGLGYIRHNQNLSKEGKIFEAKKLQETYFTKVKTAGVKHLTDLTKNIDVWIEKYKQPSQDPKYLIGKKLPQLMYVTSMLNSIDSPELLNEMLEYVSDDENFSDELVNLVYVKANSMMKAYDKPKNETIENNWGKEDKSTNEHGYNAQMNVIGIMKDKKIIQNVLDEINQYKTDYSKDASDLKQRFDGWIKNNDYPTNLYMKADIKRDFGLPSDLKEEWGSSPVKSNDPWARE